MPEHGIRSTYSQCPFQIQTYDGQGLLATGSAFFYVYCDIWFLITNWHIFSGRHFRSKEPLNSSCRFPTRIRAKWSKYWAPDSGYPSDSFTTVAQPVEIYKDYEPLWFEHSELGSDCDVVALPLDRPDDCPPFMHNAVNQISKVRIPVEPGCTVYILGFPMSISVGFGLPLWKSGYIASEPHYDVTINGQVSDVGGLTGGIKLPAFFIDSQTREGMSGAPVFASYTGNWDTEDPYAPWDTKAQDFFTRNDIYLGTEAKEFVGCYSGRIRGNEQEAALGLCWRKDVIDHICSSRKPGKHPHIKRSSK